MEPSIVLVTGSAGLVGSEVAKELASTYHIIGVDNFIRGKLLKDPSADPSKNYQRLKMKLGDAYDHFQYDVRDLENIQRIVSLFGNRLTAIVHCAAQTAHEGSVIEDFEINVTGTLNLLECWRRFAPQARFIYMSTIKVYGDIPCTKVQYDATATRFVPCQQNREEGGWLDVDRGFNEQMPLGQGQSSFFGRSKTAADLYVQEYRYQYGLPSYVLRPGCITGPDQLGTEAHGMLGYMMKCAYLGKPYTIYGYGGLQVRDQIYADDVANAVSRIIDGPENPRQFVFNLGGGMKMSCSTREAIKLCEEVTQRKMITSNGLMRSGDHPWWVTDCRLFEDYYMGWMDRFYGQSIKQLLNDIYDANKDRWVHGS